MDKDGHLITSMGKWMHNIPFEAVPQGFIRQLSERCYTYEDYLKMCPILNELPTYWNIALVDEKDQIKAFVWGSIDPLEKSMEVIRVTTNPKMFSFGGEVLHALGPIVKRYAQGLGMIRVYWITTKWKSFLRKFPGRVSITKARIVEVL